MSQWRSQVKAYLQLMRLPAVLTSATNILSGYALALPFPHLLFWEPLIYLLCASLSLYASGMILNDFYDQKWDRYFQKKKPLIGGEISPRVACFLGYLLQGLGVFWASRVSVFSLKIACILVLLINAYDIGLKHSKSLGGLTMAFCRFFNMLLGMSVFLERLPPHRLIFPLFLFSYVFCLTRISQMEEIQEKRLYFCCFACALILIPLLSVSASEQPLYALLFALLPLKKLGQALRLAWKYYDPPHLVQVVKVAVLGVVLMDAIVLAGHQQGLAALLCLGLLFLSSTLTRWIST